MARQAVSVLEIPAFSTSTISRYQTKGAELRSRAASMIRCSSTRSLSSTSSVASYAVARPYGKRPGPPDHSLILEDGRTLSYAIYGPSDGRPVIFLHGTPSCRLEAEGISSAGLLDKTRTRLVVPDRPGFGLSTPAPGRTILSYVDDLEALASHLGLEAGAGEVERLDWKQREYAVIGGSGGGPYATACAFEASRSPRRFVNMHKVGLFAAAPPYVSPIPLRQPSGNTPTDTSASRSYDLRSDTKFLQRDWMIKSKLVFELARRAPSLSRTLTKAGIDITTWLWGTGWGRRKLEAYVKAFLSALASDANKTKTIPPDSVTTYAKPESSKYSRSSTDTSPSPETTLESLDKETASFIALSQETWRHGPNGWIDEVRLLGESWGFDPAEIACRPSVERPVGLPLKIWHGAKDVNAPLAPMRWLVDRIEGSDLVVVEDKGHFGLDQSLKEMLEWAGTKEVSKRK